MRNITENLITDMKTNNSNEHPIVSVVVPVFNSERTIKSTVRSILDQTFRQIEVIIIDDGSCDSTPIKCGELALLDNRVKIYKLESSSGGPAKPRNLGITVAKGIWVAFCDSDDIWHSRKLELQLQNVGLNPDSILCSQIKEFSVDENVNLNQIIQSVGVVRYCVNDMLRKNRVATSSAMIKRETINRVGYFNESKDLVAIEDYDFWLRVLLMSGSNVCMINVPLTYYRLSSGSLSANKVSMLIKVAKLLWFYSVREKTYGSIFRWASHIAFYCILSFRNRIILKRM